MASELRTAGVDVEPIPRTVHAERDALAVTYKEQTPEPLRTPVYARSIVLYGDRLGPTIENLRSREKSWYPIMHGATCPGEDISEGTGS